MAATLARWLRTEGRRVEILSAVGDVFARPSALPPSVLYLPHTDLERIGLMAEVLARNGVLVIVLSDEVEETVRTRHSASGTPLVEFRLDAGQTLEQSMRSVRALLAAHVLA
ncbi:hypothetical protein [Streptomyces sp. NPDC059076]|uniref:hypothetical protein n=1 Tax=unclassified Streptomyces TaxID=2593676 RepID=UPI00368F94C0